MNDNKCSVKHCRNEIAVFLPGRKGLCKEHWEEHCDGIKKEKQTKLEVRK